MKKYLKLCLLLAWMALIYYMSSQTSSESSEVSNGLLYEIGLLLKIKNLYGFVDAYSTFIRKAAHFGEYLILGILTYLNLKGKGKNAIFISIIIGVLYGISDELHQNFVPGRSCEVLDMCIDSLGVITGNLLGKRLLCYQEKKH